MKWAQTILGFNIGSILFTLLLCLIFGFYDNLRIWLALNIGSLFAVCMVLFVDKPKSRSVKLVRVDWFDEHRGNAIRGFAMVEDSTPDETVVQMVKEEAIRLREPHQYVFDVSPQVDIIPPNKVIIE